MEIRARGNSLSTVSNWVLNLIFAQISPIALADVGFRFFYAFFAFNLCAVACYFFFYPETRGKTLEEMNVLFGDEVLSPALGRVDKSHGSLGGKSEIVESEVALDSE